MKIFNVKIVAFALAFGLMAPAITLAQSANASGTITVSVSDQDGKSMTGSWFLYQGVSDAGLLIRNGSVGESFQIAPGNYFLKTQSVAGYNSGMVTTSNPQSLTDGGHVRFRISYEAKPVEGDNFINRYDAEAVAIAQIAAERAKQNTVSTAHGFKSTDGTEVASAPQAPTTIVSNTANSNTTPVAQASAPTGGTVMQLAQTGPGLLWALMAAMGTSLALVRVRKA